MTEETGTPMTPEARLLELVAMRATAIAEGNITATTIANIQLEMYKLTLSDLAANVLSEGWLTDEEIDVAFDDVADGRVDERNEYQIVADAASAKMNAWNALEIQQLKDRIQILETDII